MLCWGNILHFIEGDVVSISTYTPACTCRCVHGTQGVGYTGLTALLAFLSTWVERYHASI